MIDLIRFMMLMLLHLSCVIA